MIISSYVIKHSVLNLAHILAKLVNCSMSNGVVPDELKNSQGSSNI